MLIHIACIAVGADVDISCWWWTWKC